MSKNLKKSELDCFLGRIGVDKGSTLVFAKNYFAYRKDSVTAPTLLGYILFLKDQLKFYRMVVRYGEESFEEFLDRNYPPIEEPEIEEESKLDNHLRENFVEEQKISIKDLLELIEEFQEE